MAIEFKQYKRPLSALNKYSASKIFLSPLKDNRSTITTTVSMSPLITGQNYTPVDMYVEDIICAGTPMQIGLRFGFLLTDTKAGDMGEFCTVGALVLVQIFPGEVFELGYAVYLEVSNGLAYPSPTIGGTFYQIGFVEGDLSGNPTIINPEGLPAGEYVYCRLH